jgi:hypothetical protein
VSKDHTQGQEQAERFRALATAWDACYPPMQGDGAVWERVGSRGYHASVLRLIAGATGRDAGGWRLSLENMGAA